MSTTYRIAEVAERSGFSPATLRYYEGLGLVRPGRSESGYRQYDDRTLQRLRFIARAKALGCSLDEIAELSTLWDAGQCAHVQERLQAAVEAKAAASQRQIAELALFTAELRRAAAALAATPATGACDDACACLTDTAPSPAPPAAASVAPVPAAATSSAVTSPAATSPVGAPATATSAAVTSATFTSAAGGSTEGDDDGGEPEGDACGPAACGCGAGLDVASGEPAIACALDGGAQAVRVDEWTAALAGVVGRHAVDGGVRLDLGPGTDVAAVARLAAAEQECCGFFRFALSMDARGVALEVRAPDEAADLVTALFGAPH